MTEEPREKFFGQTISEWLDGKVHELEGDAVGLYAIIPCGRHDFGLEGEALIAFTRRALLAVLRAGARPVQGVAAPPHWEWAKGYEGTPEEIAEKIIAEWQRGGMGDPTVEDIWFATPRIYED